MDKTKFLTIYPTFENLKVVKKTLPSVLEESSKNNSKVIVHDCSVHNKEEKWQYLKDLKKTYNFLLVLSDNISAAHSRNMCLTLGMEMYAPDYICMLEDDHGYKKGTIESLISAMSEGYGEVSPNGLRYGMFTTCYKHTRAVIKQDKKFGLDYPKLSKKTNPFTVAGANNCFRCAPTSHWISVLGRYDTDEYLLSEFQTSGPRWRNYHKGFTVGFVGKGKLEFFIQNQGRGVTSKNSLRLWDDKYAASDSRSKYLGKKSNFTKITNLVTKLK